MQTATSPRPPSPTRAPRWVVVLDHRCARFFAVLDRRRDDRRIVSLAEGDALVNPEANISDADLFGSTKTGARYSTRVRGGHVTSFDDHRAQHRDTNGDRFARLVVAHARTLLGGADEPVVWCAGPKMMGQLREHLSRAAPGLRGHEVQSNLTSLTPSALATQLTAAGVIPRSDPHVPTRR